MMAIKSALNVNSKTASRFLPSMRSLSRTKKKKLSSRENPKPVIIPALQFG
jgi:hypothetical protein